MCGIAGLVWKEPRSSEESFEAIRRMTRAQAHRGPDGEGWMVADHSGIWLQYENGRGEADVSGRGAQGASPRHGPTHLALGHRRLSIIDLALGKQPMADARGRHWVTFNGEIYNYRELRRKLEARGHQFSTASDTEVVVTAYAEWGAGCAEHLDGMFAFGIWDEPRQVLLLARDRLGIKPLVWARSSEGLLFGSELKGLLASGLLSRTVRPSALARFLHNLYVPAPEGPLEGVNLLEPGRILTFDNGRVDLRRYWQISFDKSEKRSSEEWLSAFSEKLRSSVRSHLMSDVPLGAFLSGGLDSSSIAALMTQEVKGRVHTLSVGFDQKEHDESKDAELVARHLASEHSTFTVSMADIEGAWERVLVAYDQPFADSSALPTMLLCEAASQQVKVAMAGDGADELLAGYPRSRHYLALEAVRRVSRLGPISSWLQRGANKLGARRKVWAGLAGFLAELPSPGDSEFAYAYLRNQFRNGWYERVLTREFQHQTRGVDPAEHIRAAAREAGSRNPLERVLYVELLTYLPNDILQKVDIASMAYGLEVRVPFLDHHLVELVANMPSGLKWNGRETKVALRAMTRPLLPEATFRKRKQGFHLPVDAWFRGRGRDIAQDVLLSSTCLSRGYFERKGIESLLSLQQSGHKHGGRLWALLQFEMWHRKYVDEPYRAVTGYVPAA